MGLSNGFGAIAGIIVPLGKPSIVKSGCQLQLDEIDNSNLYSQTQYSQFSILFSKLKITLDLEKISEMVSLVDLNFKLIIIEGGSSVKESLVGAPSDRQTLISR